MDRQIDWRDFFEAEKRQREAREALIDKLAVDDRVKKLLIALDKMAESHPTSKNLHNGTVSLKVPIGVIAFHLGRSENATKSYIDLAGATPYLAVAPSTHRSHTYLVRWPAIVDGTRPDDETTVRGCQTDARSVGTQRAGGSIRGSGRGSIRGSTAPQVDPQTGPQLAPNLTPSYLGIKNLGVYGNSSKDLGSNLGITGGQPAKPRKVFPHGFWPWWRGEVAKRNLRDPLDVDELYGLGVAAGLYAHSPVNRFRVFVQAAHDVAMAPSPGAYFRNNVARCDWHHANAHDEDLAMRMLAAADSGESDPLPMLPPAPPAEHDGDAPIVIPTNLTISDEDTARLRQEQTQALLAAWKDK